MRYLKAIIAAFKLQLLGGKIRGEFPVVNVSHEAGKHIVTVVKHSDNQVPGIQSMFWDSRIGHSIVRPLSASTETVSYEILKNFRNQPKQGDLVWVSGWLGEEPKDFGMTEYTEVTLSNSTTAIRTSRNSSNWVIHVHGRNAAVAETMRNYAQFDDLGYNQLFLAHESDAPPLGLGKRKSDLGSTEWRQVEAAVDFAKSHGSKNIVLVGWSLGGMIVGQFALNSNFREGVQAIILDSPLIDYPSTLRLQARRAGLDEDFGDYVAWLLTKSRLLRVLGYGYEKLPSLLKDLGLPVLVLYSRTDGFVSMERIEEFGEINKEATLVEFKEGRHCRLYNQDEKRYKEIISRFLAKLQS